MGEIEHHGVDSLQRFIDSVCRGMDDAHSLGHHIVMRSSNDVLQAQSHHRASDEMLRSVESAAKHAGHRGQFQGRELIVGVARYHSTTVYVSEFIDDLRSEVIRNESHIPDLFCCFAVINHQIIASTLLCGSRDPIGQLAGGIY